VSRRRRLIALLILLVFVTGSGYVGWRLSRIAPIGTAYAAKILCSEVFVAGRAPEPVIAEDVQADNIWLLRLVHARVDSARQQASATFLGLARREAQFRPGLGCTLALGSRPVPAPRSVPPALV
jgi:hypothetical protein